VNGRAPVILFFVLSGFVLAVSLEGRALGPGASLRFACRRLCRIYLPYAGMVLIAACASSATASLAPALKGWAARLWSEQASVGLVVRHLMMPVAGVDLTLDRVAWSLVHEIRISVVFPLLLLASRSSLALVLGSLMLFMCGHRWSGCSTLGCLPYNGADTAASLWASVYFVPFFALGLLLARHRSAVSAAAAWAGPVGLAFAWIVAVAGLIAPFKFELLPDSQVGVAATLLLALVLNGGRPARLLGWAPFRWLGRVSFSLYLCHLVVLALVLRLGAGSDRATMLAASVLFSLLAAECVYRLAEAPCVRLGRWLAAPGNGKIGCVCALPEQELAWTGGTPAA
jgi:peptidoglycan/LPS O-acetylase OafA/YrhL